jgi:cell division protein FtsQ
VGTADNVQILLASYQEFKSLVKSANLRIHELGCNARRAWYMVLDNQLKLLLGRGENRLRLERFLNLYPRLATKLMRMQNGGQTLVSVDLRYTNGLAVQLAQRQN